MNQRFKWTRLKAYINIHNLKDFSSFQMPCDSCILTNYSSFHPLALCALKLPTPMNWFHSSSFCLVHPFWCCCCSLWSYGTLVLEGFSFWICCLLERSRWYFAASTNIVKRVHKKGKKMNVVMGIGVGGFDKQRQGHWKQRRILNQNARVQRHVQILLSGFDDRLKKN